MSASELTEATLRSIDESNGKLHAFLAVAPERALARATAADKRASRGEFSGPLHGLPVAVKDLQETSTIPTSFGTEAMRGYLPEHDAVIVERLENAGAVIVAKTNTPAFGTLGETRNRLGPDCRNPWDPALTSGGSSGGSAAAVAAGVIPLATGTDAAGSIACPASFCGVVGVKPTRGLVPYWPNNDDSLLLNYTGPIAADVADAALMLTHISGPDPRDPFSGSDMGAVPEVAETDDQPLEGIRIAFTADLGHFAVDDSVAAAAASVASALEDLGATVEGDEPTTENPLDVYMPIYATDFRRWARDADDTVLDEIELETWDELEEYPALAAEDYVGHLTRVWNLQATVAQFFRRFDLLISPATACSAFPVGEPPSRIGGRLVRPGWQSFMPFQVPWNLTGHPTVCVPCDRTPSEKPIGVLLVGRLGSDADLLRAAAALESTQRTHGPSSATIVAAGGGNGS